MNKDIKRGFAIILAMLVIGGAAGYFSGHHVGYGTGHLDGMNEAISEVQASCENPEARTQLNDRVYLCFTEKDFLTTVRRLIKEALGLQHPGGHSSDGTI
jgi:hypothetical protein